MTRWVVGIARIVLHILPLSCYNLYWAINRNQTSAISQNIKPLEGVLVVPTFRFNCVLFFLAWQIFLVQSTSYLKISISLEGNGRFPKRSAKICSGFSGVLLALHLSESSSRFGVRRTVLSARTMRKWGTGKDLHLFIVDFRFAAQFVDLIVVGVPLVIPGVCARPRQWQGSTDCWLFLILATAINWLRLFKALRNKAVRIRSKHWSCVLYSGLFRCLTKLTTKRRREKNSDYATRFETLLCDQSH